MDVTGETRVRDLLREHPELLEFMRGYAPAFQRLSDPGMLATVGRVATLSTAASVAGIPVERLVEDVRAEIVRQRGGAAAAEPVGAERRVVDLADIIRQLHEGATVEQVKERFAELVGEVDSSEIAAMEQALIADGMPVSEVQRLCDVHVSVFRESLDETAAGQAPAGHPFDTYLRENEVLARIVSSTRAALDALQGATIDGREPVAELSRLGGLLDELSQVDVHYLRKENQLFPLLERHGVAGPTQVMWGLDDDIRRRIKAARRDVERSEVARLLDELPTTLGMVEDMAYKEEKILLPVAMETLSGVEWAEMAAGEEAIGFAWIEPVGTPVQVTLADSPSAEPPAAEPGAEALLPLTTGALTPTQLDLILRRLPVDVTFVDENGEVRYYSEGQRVFPRSPAVIGRAVRNCHPPKSVAIVERIVEQFRAGTKDSAEFWIELHGRFVWIRYIALRDDGGMFRGVLEVTQDATHVRELEGERRLLDWK